MGFFIWFINNLSVINVTGPWSNVFLLRILIFICIFIVGTIVLDIIPLREFVNFFTKRLDKERVAIHIGDSQIIELDKIRLTIIHRINLIIAIGQVIASLFVYFLAYLYGTSQISIKEVTVGNIALNQITAEYLFISCLIIFGSCLFVSGSLMIYMNREIISLGI